MQWSLAFATAHALTHTTVRIYTRAMCKQSVWKLRD